MGSKLWYTGVTIILAVAPFFEPRITLAVGAIITVIGCVMIWLDK